MSGCDGGLGFIHLFCQKASLDARPLSLLADPYPGADLGRCANCPYLLFFSIRAVRVCKVEKGLR